jgi:hypothetical protein
MKVGDLVCRKYVSEGQRQRVLKFNPQTTNVGIITKIDKEQDICEAWFTGGTETIVLPIAGDYLEVISETA